VVYSTILLKELLESPFQISVGNAAQAPSRQFDERLTPGFNELAFQGRVAELINHQTKAVTREFSKDAVHQR
jgi:hypothetical protein